MLTLLEIRRAEFNKNLENPLYDGISHLGGGGVKYAWHKAFVYFRLILPWMGKVPKADGVIQLTLSNPSSSLALSLAVYKFISLAGFTCWFGEAEQLPLLWGGRSCVSIANYRFGEGVHPVWVKTRHCEACEARRGNPVGITPSGFQPPSPSREGTKIRRCYAND